MVNIIGDAVNITQEWTKNELKHFLKHLFKRGALICRKYKFQISKTLKNRLN